MEALGRLFGRLPAGFRSPVAVVQHRAAAKTDGALSQYLGRRCTLSVVEAEDKEPLQERHVYLAPADYHLLVEDGFLSLSLEGPVAYSRPSIDVLFESAAAAYGPGVTAVVMTGTNRDGSRGAVAVRDAGGTVLAQDPSEAERAEMPAAAIATGAVHEVLTIPRLADRLAEMDEVD
jgi:two-component system chemotaxis response regulator CheB